jgi:hypothetical protein
MADIEQLRPPNPSHSISSTLQSPTINTADIFPATTCTKITPSPGLSNNPVSNTIVLEDGSLKTIIKTMPFQQAKQIIISAKKQMPKVQTTDIYIEENPGKSFLAFGRKL